MATTECGVMWRRTIRSPARDHETSQRCRCSRIQATQQQNNTLQRACAILQPVNGIRATAAAPVVANMRAVFGPAKGSRRMADALAALCRDPRCHGHGRDPPRLAAQDASRLYCGTCGVYPQPVSPATITCWRCWEDSTCTQLHRSDAPQRCRVCCLHKTGSAPEGTRYRMNQFHTQAW